MLSGRKEGGTHWERPPGGWEAQSPLLRAGHGASRPAPSGTYSPSQFWAAPRATPRPPTPLRARELTEPPHPPPHQTVRSWIHCSMATQAAERSVDKAGPAWSTGTTAHREGMAPERNWTLPHTDSGPSQRGPMQTLAAKTSPDGTPCETLLSFLSEVRPSALPWPHLCSSASHLSSVPSSTTNTPSGHSTSQKPRRKNPMESRPRDS